MNRSSRFNKSKAQKIAREVSTSLATFGINPRDGKDMFIADDYATFSKYVIMLLNNIELRKKIINNALTLAKKFDHIHAAEKLEQVLKNV